MKLIVGLGNPEARYNFTRHNFGFLALDFFAKSHQLEWQYDKKFDALITKWDQNLLLKPHNYYNNSGESVQKALNFYKLNPSEDLLVICDDLNLPFGQIRQRAQGSHGGNNGLKSITNQLNTSVFPRIRLGTDNESRKLLGDTDFVLAKFTADERKQLPNILAQVAQLVESQ